MDKKMVLAALGIVALSAGMALAGTAPGTGVVDSIHDMNHYDGTTPDGQGRVCAFCHTPHHAITAGNDYLPLWSHLLPSTSYSAYASATIDAQMPDTTNSMMEGPSKLCMSCHDGAIAVDTHYSTTDNGAKHLNSDDWNGAAISLTNTLANDHPIGFIFEDVAGGNANGTPGTTDGKDNYIKSAEATYIGNPNITIEDRLYVSAPGEKGIMTCATCHDVHNKKNVEKAGNANYLLLSPNDGSKLCLSCHIK